MDTDSLGEDDPVVPGSVEIAKSRGLLVAPLEVKTSRGCIVVSRRRLDDNESRATVPQPSLELRHQRAANAKPLGVRVHGDPVQVERSIGGRRRAETDVADQLLAIEG